MAPDHSFPDFHFVVVVAIPVSFLAYNYLRDTGYARITNRGDANDASNLNATRIGSKVNVPEIMDEAISQISFLIKHANDQGKKISIAGAQHSMGGHTIYPDGIMLDMKGFHYMKFDSLRNILTVGSGALWAEIIPFLDMKGKSIAIMQSNNSFSVGGSLSVNCHGWQPNSPPISSSVESFRLINAEGKILNCSREENPELFSLVLGGYGLFGVILDVDLRVVDNKVYKVQQSVIRSSDYIKKFNELVNGRSDVGMVYGRININPVDFMDEAILSIFTIDSNAIPKAVEKGSYASIRRTVFRSSANSDFGKNLRWSSEKLAASQISGTRFSRNQLLNEGVEVFQNSDTSYTDILHEYFIPSDSVVQFIRAVKKVVPAYKADLLNITIRNVKKDDLTFMRYAHGDVFGFVMLFNQSRDSIAEADMQALTQRLIDIAISMRGTYYLTYRLHATKAQMHKAYPMAPSFFTLKKKYDPKEIFQNKFYQAYK